VGADTGGRAHHPGPGPEAHRDEESVIVTEADFKALFIEALRILRDLAQAYEAAHPDGAAEGEAGSGADAEGDTAGDTAAKACSCGYYPGGPCDCLRATEGEAHKPCAHLGDPDTCPGCAVHDA
jgi:hypothetical protein